MCGKTTQRNNRSKSKLISDPQEICRFLAIPGIEVANLLFANGTILWASWRFSAEEKIANLLHMKEVIWVLVTADARIDLYFYLGPLQEKALYKDTDSVLLIQKEELPLNAEILWVP